MVTITVKDEDTGQEMNITVTGTLENAKVDTRFDPPIEGERNDMWGRIAQIVFKAFIDA